MRQRAGTSEFSVHAIAGTHVVLLGIDVAASSRVRRGLLGFAIHRTNRRTGDAGWLRSMKTFSRFVSPDSPARLRSTFYNPLQGFLWGDYITSPGNDYGYRVVPMYGSPGRLVPGDPVEVRVRTESEDSGVHAIHFNRGAAASQAYLRRFANRPPDQVGPEAYAWLSRGLEEALLRFLDQARGRGSALRAAVYEFSHPGVLAAFEAAVARGVDVRIVCDLKPSKASPRHRNLEAIANTSLRVGHEIIERRANPSYIAHNKFIVLLQGGRPQAVWTGSTNLTSGGIYGHSNVGHIIRDPGLAAAFLAYWTALSADPDASELRAWNEGASPLPETGGRRGPTPVFSPRRSLAALQHYARMMDLARGSVFFTAAFGVNPLLRAVLAKNRPYLRYLLLERDDKYDAADPDVETYKRDRNNVRAVGSHLTPNVLEHWVQKNFGAEELTGTNKHVKYIHTKYMLIDPLGDRPRVITGSANFSDASTRANDENMVIIDGDPRVADVYLGEFMRLFHHYRFRWRADLARAKGLPPAKLHLTDDPSWQDAYYAAGSFKAKERQLFR